MKMKTALKSLVMIALGVTIFASCQKESISPALSEQEQEVIQDIQDELINDLSIQIDEEFMNSEVMGGDENADFYMENDGLPEAYLLDEGDLELLGKRPPKLVRCLIGVQPDSAQKLQIRKAMSTYADCKRGAVKNYRSDLLALNRKVAAERKKLVDAFKNQRITRQQFQDDMKKLRARYAQASKDIKQKYAATFKSCYTDFLKSLKRILSSRQWTAFVNCLR